MEKGGENVANGRLECKDYSSMQHRAKDVRWRGTPQWYTMYGMSVWSNVWRGSHTVQHEEAENKEENRVKRELHRHYGVCRLK